MSLFKRYRHFRRAAVPAAYALDLARAEAWREEEEDAGRLRVRWEWDDQPWDGDAPAPKELLGCVVELRDGDCSCDDGPAFPGAEYGEHCSHWRHAESLWSIGDPDRAYRRYVEAELCGQAMAEAVESIARAVPQL